MVKRGALTSSFFSPTSLLKMGKQPLFLSKGKAFPQSHSTSSTIQENFYSAAEITKTNGGGASSAWIAATNQPTQPVPEPTTMLLLSAGLIGLGFFGRKRSLK